MDKEFVKNFKFKKKYGQNFIVDDNILNNIVCKSNIKKDTLVIEIGCGAGALTTKILEHTKLFVGYEIDVTLKEELDKLNTNIIYDDFLKRNVKKDIEKYDYNELYVVSNLPYYITTPILTKIIESNLDVDKIVVMVQKEVGDRFSAIPNTKDYNSLTIFMNYYFDVKKMFIVSKNVFVPKPNVDSIVLSFTKKDNKYNVINEEHFFKLVRDAFTQKRKTLKNNLKNYDFSIINEILKKYNYNEDVRAEALTIDVFVDISNALQK